MKDFWENMYSSEAYAYGKEPNIFFKSQLDSLAPATLLMAAEGEGRNAVYAATQGWKVTAYDWSEKAREKALALADEKGVQIDYLLGSLNDLKFDHPVFDAIGIVFVQFPENQRRDNMHRLISFLKPGGTLIMEAFSKAHLDNQKENPRAGGPKNSEQLYDIDSLKKDFKDFDIRIAKEESIHLEEGLYHHGRASVVRFLGTKI